MTAVFSGVVSACSSNRSWTRLAESNATSVRFHSASRRWSDPVDEAAAMLSKVVVIVGEVSGAAHKIVFYEEAIDSGAEKSLDRLVWRVDDRLPLYVETRIQHDLAPGNFAERFQQRVERRVVIRRNGLHARGTVDVSDCGQGCAILLADDHGRDHVGQRSHRRDVKPSIDFLD